MKFRLIFLSILLSFCVNLHAKVKKEKYLNCATDNFPPYSYLKKGKGKKKLIGIEVDLFKEALRRLGLKGKLKILPWQRMMFEMKEGLIDCMFAAFWTPQRSGFMNFTHVPFHVSTLGIYINKDKKFKFTGISDLVGKNFALPIGFKTSPKFDALVKTKKVNVKEVKLMDNAFQMVNLKRVDAVISNTLVAQGVIKKFKLKNVYQFPKPLTANSAFLTFSKKGKFPNLAPDFDAVLFDILADGTYLKMMKKY